MSIVQKCNLIKIMCFIFFKRNQKKQNQKIVLFDYKKLSFSILLCILTSTIFSQTVIKGSVQTSENVRMQNVSVLLVNENEDLLSYTSTNKNGSFSFEVYDNTRKFLVFRAIGYQENKIELINNKTNLIDLDGLILQSKPIELKEIVLDIKKPIFIKKDTIIFDA